MVGGVQLHLLNSGNSAKKQKAKVLALFKLGAVSIIISQCSFMRCDNYDKTLDSHLFMKDLKYLIVAFSAFPS